MASRAAARNRNAGGPDPDRQAVTAWRGQSLRLRSHCREPASWVRIRKPPRWSAERGPGRAGTGGRASQRDRKKECACRRSIHPSSGVTVRTRHEGNDQPARKLAARERERHGQRRDSCGWQVAKRGRPFAGRVGLFDIVDLARGVDGNTRLPFAVAPPLPIARRHRATSEPQACRLSAAGSSTGTSARARCGAGRRSRRWERPRRSRRDP